MDESLTSVIGGLICLSTWAFMAVVAGGLGHLWMQRVEGTLGRRAEPTAERVQLFYAGASILWASAAALALVGFARRDWARMGRNCLFIFLGHITLLTALVVFVTPHSQELGPIVIVACAIAAAGSVGAAFFAGRWGLARAARIEAEPSTGTEPLGSLRYLLYVGSLMLWPVGLVSVFAFSKPETAQTGVTSFVLSLVNIVSIAFLVCSALPFLVYTLA